MKPPFPFFSGESGGAGVREARAEEVCLVLMPYADVSRPSLALGILKSSLRGTGIGCRVEYANIRFTEMVGWDMPDLPYLERLLGEWIFSSAAFPGREAARATDLIESGVKQTTHIAPDAFRHPRLAEALENLRRFAAVFVDRIAQEIVATRPRIVGCSSTFEQHCASLGLLRRVKELDPSIFTMLGGANCEAEMGWTTLKEFDWVDCVVSGEADELFPKLCRRILETGGRLESADFPNGAMGRVHAAKAVYDAGRLPPPRATVPNMDSSPVPDYADYFEALGRSTLADRITPGLLVETSRGCWWGQKSHCTFCGLNGSGMSFRSKSPERALQEFNELASRYKVPRFMVVDNIIDMGYFNSVLPSLSDLQAPYKLFYETKSNLKRAQVEALHKAGIIWIQPGIEGFHDDLLRLMAKGNKGMMNLQLLKYTREFGMHTTWLLLFGFPGEEDSWHAEVAAWLPLVVHLQPPRCIGRVLFDRFSVYHSDPDRFGIRLEPAPAYSGIYPISPEALGDMAYFFTNTAEENPAPAGKGVASLAAEVVRWSKLHKREIPPLLCMDHQGDKVSIFDTRPCATARRIELEGLEAAVFLACEPAVTRAGLPARLRNSPYADATPEDLDRALQSLVDLKLVLFFQDQYLNLAVPGPNPTICPPEEFPGGSAERLPKLDTRAVEDFASRMERLLETNLEMKALAT